MSTPSREDILQFSRDLASRAGAMMRENFSGAGEHYVIKGDTTPVSVTDTAINRLVIEAVARHFPEHAVLGEEESSEGGRNRYLWVCDPIDGTFPFTHGIPTSTFNLAYVEDGIPQVGVTYDPFQNRLYEAVRGQGARLNAQRLHLGTLPSRGDERGAISVEVRCGKGSLITDDTAIVAMHGQILAWNQLPIYLCSAAYEAMLVANGALNGVVFGGINPWDGAAVGLIVKEAGGCMTDLLGREQRYDGPICGFIAARPEWHERLLDLVRPHVKAA